MVATANTMHRYQVAVPASVEPDVVALLYRLVEDELPGRRGLSAWSSLLRAHATLIRQLETDLERATGLALADFDVLASSPTRVASCA